jgi:uncharacterized protein (TIGR04222 family)
MSKPDLLTRVEQFEFNDGSPRLTFERRLARENGWSAAYTRRVVCEYRRFAFLGVAAGHPVSPPEAVDQAWHLHLTFTESYWNRFCGEVLRSKLHHHPTRGGPEEHARFREWYAQTLDSYRRLIGEEPPGDIWPEPERHAATFTQSRWVDLEQNWIIPRRRVVFLGAWSVVFSLVLWIPGCGGPAAGATNPFSLDGPHFLVLYVALLAIAAAAGCTLRFIAGRSASESNALEPILKDPYGVACLAGGVNNVVTTALAKMVERGNLQIRKYQETGWLGTRRSDHSIRRGDPLPEHAPEVERTLYEHAGEKGLASPAQLVSAGKAVAQAYHERLHEWGLVQPDEDEPWSRRGLPASFTGIVAVFGIARLVQGLIRERPVGYLVLLVALAVIGTIAFYARGRLTPLGKRRLRALQREHRAAPRAAARGGVAGPELALAIGLFGLAQFTMTPELHDLNATLRQHRAGPYEGSSSGGCATGCGGGGCGGGGGGCGGCGG